MSNTNIQIRLQDIESRLDNLENFKESSINKVDNLDNPNTTEYPSTYAVHKELHKKASKTTLNQHMQDMTNPHNVTAEQVGAYTKHYIDTLFVDIPSNTDLQNHLISVNNPHEVTAEQVNTYDKEYLDNKFRDLIEGRQVGDSQTLLTAKEYVDDFIYMRTEEGEQSPTLFSEWLNTYKESIANKVQTITNDENHYPSTSAVHKALNKKADDTTLTKHIENKKNPHNVTANQIGAMPKSVAVDKLNQKVDKFIRVAGLQLSNSITPQALTNNLLPVTENRQGVMTPADKQKLETLFSIYELSDEMTPSDFLDLLQEVTQIIENSGEGTVEVLDMLSNKVDKEQNKSLSTNDYNDTDKNKVDIFDEVKFLELIDMLEWSDEEEE